MFKLFFCRFNEKDFNENHIGAKFSYWVLFRCNFYLVSRVVKEKRVTFLNDFLWKFGLAFAINFSEEHAPFTLKVSNDINECIGQTAV